MAEGAGGVNQARLEGGLATEDGGDGGIPGGLGTGTINDWECLMNALP